MRITGLATGLDMDQIIKDSMKPYRIKIDQQQQKKDIIEIKQKLYREVLKDSREFYNKYFDVGSKDNLLLSSNYTTVKYTSSNDGVVSVKGSSDSKSGTYTVKGEIGKAAKAVVTDGIEKGNKININGKEYELKGETQKEIAKNLNEELKKDKVNVTVKYTDMAGTATGNKSGLVFESTEIGADSTFTIGGSFKEIAGTVVEGTDATASTISGISVKSLVLNDGEFKVGDKTIKIDIKKDSSDEDIQKLLNEKLKEEKITVAIKEGKMTFSSTDVGNPDAKFKIDVNGETGKFTAGEKGTATTNTVSADALKGKISINGTVIDMSNAEAGKEVDYLNKMLSGKGITASKNDAGEFVFTSNEIGKDKKIEIKVYEGDGTNPVTVEAGRDAKITIEDGKGGVYTHTGNSNTVVIDGITFNFTGEIPEAGVIITGKNDVTELKDKIVGFVNDYNKLMESLNTVIKDKPNKEFMPLTEEQKKDMSEDEIKLWNEKVKKGQLSRDTDITRIVNNLKNALTTPVNGGGLNLEKIGITPLADYGGTKNGTFTIDEGKLTKALEENLDDVMNMFIGQPKETEGMTEGEKYGQTGLMHRMKDILYKETVTVESRLVKKAGIEGSATVSNNELTRTMERHEKKIRDMEKDFARREQALYSKYARLEVMMNKYNSQQSYLAQQMGM